MTDKLNNENSIRNDVNYLIDENYKDLVLSNTTKDEELTLDKLLKFLSGEESINGRWFGETYEGEPAFWWRPKLKRLIKRYGLEQRIFGAQYAKQEIMREEESDAVYNIDVFIANLKQQLTPEEQEKL